MKKILFLIVLLSWRASGQVLEASSIDPILLKAVDMFVDSTSNYGYPNKFIIIADITHFSVRDSNRVEKHDTFGKVVVGSDILSYDVEFKLVRNSNTFLGSIPSAYFIHRDRKVYLILGVRYFFDLTQQGRKGMIRQVKAHLGVETPGVSEVAFMGCEVRGSRIVSTPLVRLVR